MRSGPLPVGQDVAVVVEQLRRAVPGGIGTYCTGLLHGLGELRAAGRPVPGVALVASRSPTRPDPLDRFGFPVRALGVPGPVLTRAWGVGLLPVGGGGVVHALSLASPPPGRRRLVVTVHDVAWRRFPDAYPRRGRHWHEAALRRARRWATAVVVPSPAVADDLVADGFARHAVVVVEHGCDHLPAPDEPATDALLARLGVAGPFVLSVGTLEPRKNLGRLVEAHRRASAELADPLPLVVVGPAGWGRHHRAGHGGGPDAATGPVIVPTGRVDDAVLAGLYRRARLLAYVPLTEGYGLPPVEAMRAGVPVLSSPLPSTGGACVTVDPTDVAAMARGLVSVATDEGLRADLVDRGRQRASRRWRDAAADHVALWEELR